MAMELTQHASNHCPAEASANTGAAARSAEERKHRANDVKCAELHGLVLCSTCRGDLWSLG